MTVRYWALVWNANDIEQDIRARGLARELQHSRAQLRLVWAVPGVIVCVPPSESEVHLLGAEGGVVVGTLFRRVDQCSVPVSSSVESEESLRVTTSGGRRLIEQYWGRYVAFFRSPGGDCVLRDPTGAVPCWSMRLTGIDVYFSWLPDVMSLGLRLSMNWDYLVQRLLCGAPIYARATGLREITQVLGSECVCRRGDEWRSALLWDPVSMVTAEWEPDFNGTVSQVRRGVMDCVQAWAQGRGRLLHLQSGGLDSSVIFWCLSRAAPKLDVSALTFYFPDPHGDERGLAKVMADAVGKPLIALERRGDFDLRRMMEGMQAMSSPENLLFCLDTRAIQQIASQLGAQGVMTGWGGDQVWKRDGGRYVGAEALLRQRCPRRWGRSILDGARMDRTSVWAVMGELVNELVFEKGWTLEREDLPPDQVLVTAGTLARCRGSVRFEHPWVNSAICNGKRIQLYYSVVPNEPFGSSYQPGDALWINPMVSQPLIELALRIPLYWHVYEGRDRAALRYAFRDLPREIILRRGKGGQEQYIRCVWERSFPYIRDRLLDGWLTRLNVVDREQIGAALAAGNKTQIYSRTWWDLLSLEAWVERMQILGVRV